MSDRLFLAAGLCVVFAMLMLYAFLSNLAEDNYEAHCRKDGGVMYQNLCIQDNVLTEVEKSQ